jgi:hypothetical protein
MKAKLLFAMIAVTATVTGCQEQASVMSSFDAHEGTTAVYPVDAAHAFDTAMLVLHQEGACSVEDHRGEGYLLADYDMTPVSWGTFAGVWVEPVAPHTSRVTVVTKRKVAINAVTVLTEQGFQERFAQMLAQNEP